MRIISLYTESESLITRCEMVLQHKWDEAHLVGLSKRGKEFLAAHEGEKVTVLIHSENHPNHKSLRLAEVTETEAG